MREGSHAQVHNCVRGSARRRLWRQRLDGRHDDVDATDEWRRLTIDAAATGDATRRHGCHRGRR
jgi:hypothetical protein